MQLKWLVARNKVLLNTVYRICVDGTTMDVMFRGFIDVEIVRATKYGVVDAGDGSAALQREADILIDTKAISWISLHDMSAFPMRD